jgi:hypothetical protein
MLVSPGAGTTAEAALVQVRVDRELGGAGLRSGVLTIASSAGTAAVTVVVE